MGKAFEVLNLSKNKVKRKPKIAPAVSLTETLSDLAIFDDESPEKILLSLLDKDNVEMKTEIEEPLRLAQLKTVENACATEKLRRCAKSIKIFIYNYLVYQVSHDRQSRKETIQALQALMTNERTIGEKLTEPPARE